VARIREVFCIPDWGFLDEPVMVVGPLIFNWRRLFGLFALVVVAFVLRTGSKMPLPGLPIGLDQLLIIGVAAGFSALMLAPRKTVPVEQQLVGIFFPSKRNKRNKKETSRKVLVAKTDVIPYTLEVSGYVVDPRSGKPLDTPVQIIVNNIPVAEVPPDPTGKYTAHIELGPGLHHITVMLKEPKTILKTLKIKIIMS